MYCSERKFNLQFILADDLLPFLEKLRHIPRTRDISPSQPFPSLRKQEHHRIGRELGLINQLRVQELWHRESNLGWDSSRMQAIRHHALGTVLDVQIFGVAQERQLADLVARAAGSGQEGADAGEHDDLLVAALQHQRQQRAREQERAPDIDVPRVPPLIGVAVHRRFEFFHCAGVVDQDVESTERIGRDLGGSLNAVSIEDVEVDGFDVRDRFAGCSCSFLHFLLKGG